jgi:hypothetical protein
VDSELLQRRQHGLDVPIDHPPGEATETLQVDQSERRWNVRLPNGISAASKRVEIALIL